MKTRDMLCLVALALFGCSLSIGTNADDRNRDQEIMNTSKESVSIWLAGEIKEGDSLEKVDKAIRKYCRDYGLVRLGGSGDNDHYYLLDDFHQIRLTTDRQNKVTSGPHLEAKQPWLKLHKDEVMIMAPTGVRNR